MNIKPYLLAAALTGLSASVAQAATDGPYTDSHSQSLTEWNDSLTIPQFDPSKGTLTQVNIVYNTDILFAGNETGGVIEDGFFIARDAQAQTYAFELSASIDMSMPTGLSGDPTMSSSVTAQLGPITLNPGQRHDFREGASDSQTRVLTSASDLSIFTGTGSVTFDPVHAVGTYRTLGSSNVDLTLRTYAAASIEVTYTYDPPVTNLLCSNQLSGGGDTVTATLQGSESCTNLQFVETITCSGDLAYAAAAATPGCTVEENPNGTFTATCDVTIPKDGSMSFSVIDNITGTDGTCTSNVTSMSCVTTPTGQTLNADVGSCSASHSLIPTEPVPAEPYIPPNVPTLSQWALMLLAGMLGLIGVRAQRRKS